MTRSRATVVVVAMFAGRTEANISKETESPRECHFFCRFSGGK